MLQRTLSELLEETPCMPINLFLPFVPVFCFMANCFYSFCYFWTFRVRGLSTFCWLTLLFHFWPGDAISYSFVWCAKFTLLFNSVDVFTAHHYKRQVEIWAGRLVVAISDHRHIFVLRLLTRYTTTALQEWSLSMQYTLPPTVEKWIVSCSGKTLVDIANCKTLTHYRVGQ